jgi:hypothetical protein
MAPYHVDAADLAELGGGRIFVHRTRDPWTDGPGLRRIASWNLERVPFDEVRRSPGGRSDERIRWDLDPEGFFAGVFDRWHDGDDVPPPLPPTGGYRVPLHPRRAGGRRGR